jgi:hypothetical protein
VEAEPVDPDVLLEAERAVPPELFEATRIVLPGVAAEPPEIDVPRPRNKFPRSAALVVAIVVLAAGIVGIALGLALKGPSPAPVPTPAAADSVGAPLPSLPTAAPSGRPSPARPTDSSIIEGCSTLEKSFLACANGFCNGCRNAMLRDPNVDGSCFGLKNLTCSLGSACHDCAGCLDVAFAWDYCQLQPTCGSFTCDGVRGTVPAPSAPTYPTYPLSPQSPSPPPASGNSTITSPPPSHSPTPQECQIEGDAFGMCTDTYAAESNATGACSLLCMLDQERATTRTQARVLGVPPHGSVSVVRPVPGDVAPVLELPHPGLLRHPGVRRVLE